MQVRSKRRQYQHTKVLVIIKRESRIGANIDYIRYVLEPDYDYNTINPLYFVINLIGYVEKTEGSSGIFVDLQKVFNTNQEILLSKLDHNGIQGVANKWFETIYVIENSTCQLMFLNLTHQH